MKVIFSASALVLLLASCQKNLSDKQEASVSSTVSSDALLPLPYHSVSFTTDYPVNSLTQPFRFTKTLYCDTRVSRLQMTTRGNVNSPYFGPARIFNFDYRFAYGPNKAFITRRSKIYTDAAFSQPYQYECTFNSNGHCTEIKYVGDPAASPGEMTRLRLTYSGKRLIKISVPRLDVNTEDNYDAAEGDWDVVSDSKGNILTIKPSQHIGDQTPGYPASTVTYTYNLNKTGNYCYMPTQYLFSQWFSLLEVMQWVPMQVNERTSVNLKVDFVDWSGGTENAVNRTVTQGQRYYNHKYDANGNLISYTYGDGVAQKITWK